MTIATMAPTEQNGRNLGGSRNLQRSGIEGLERRLERRQRFGNFGKGKGAGDSDGLRKFSRFGLGPEKVEDVDGPPEAPGAPGPPEFGPGKLFQGASSAAQRIGNFFRGSAAAVSTTSTSQPPQPPSTTAGTTTEPAPVATQPVPSVPSTTSQPSTVVAAPTSTPPAPLPTSTLSPPPAALPIVTVSLQHENHQKFLEDTRGFTTSFTFREGEISVSKKGSY